MNIKINLYAFILGREHKIALAELKSTLWRLNFIYEIRLIAGNIVFVEIKNFGLNEATALINQLAGTIKIFECLFETPFEKLNDSFIKTKIISLLEIGTADVENKFDFGISSYAFWNKGYVNKLGIDIKQTMKAKHINLRFVQLSGGQELTSIQTLKNKLHINGCEIGLFKAGIGKLIALNNPEDWVKIDYKKPVADKFSGMVPPKLARMLVNIGLGISEKDKLDETLMIDSFCGSGNIVLEQMRLGFDVVASDISERAVGDTIKNVEWLKEYYSLGNKADVFICDSTGSDYANKLERYGDKYSQFIFVCEPSLGKPKKFKNNYSSTVNEYSEIRNLYVNFLKNIAGFAKNKGVFLVIIFPVVETAEEQNYNLFKICRPDVERAGFKQIGSSLLYGRDYQVVKREIVLLKWH